MDVAAQIEQLIRGAVEAEGFELVHVEFQPKGGSSTLRIYIDKPGGVNLGDCERVSRQVSVLLDVQDLIPHKYFLEVSSPGLDRPLFKEQDYLRFRGHEVKITTREKVEGRRHFTGILEDFRQGLVILACGRETYQIPYNSIKKANLVYHL